ncbi:MAG: hypothetical protein H7Y36_11575, partial [Armatimonadetes bacterium]|nr:hypothetical protein [Akkermansiaceae bacterium]
MKTKLPIIAAFFGIIGAALAEEAKPQRQNRPTRAEIIAKFDADGDGKLNKTERTAAKEARKAIRQERRKQWLAKFDQDGDGVLNAQEK